LTEQSVKALLEKDSTSTCKQACSTQTYILPHWGKQNEFVSTSDEDLEQVSVEKTRQRGDTGLLKRFLIIMQFWYRISGEPFI